MSMRDKIAQTLAYKVTPYELRMWDDLLPESRRDYLEEADAIIAALDTDALVRAALELAALELEADRDAVTALLADAYGATLDWDDVLKQRADHEAARRITELETLNAELVEALERIAHASDVYGVEANAEDQGADTLAYAHKSTCNLARKAIAKAKAAQ